MISPNPAPDGAPAPGSRRRPGPYAPSRPTCWFVIPGTSKLRLSGWICSAIKGEPMLFQDGWFAFAMCPRCGAMVAGNAMDDEDEMITFHEQWHAATDFPVPAGLLPEG
jgi:hypothetical protein